MFLSFFVLYCIVLFVDFILAWMRPALQESHLYPTSVSSRLFARDARGPCHQRVALYLPMLSEPRDKRLVRDVLEEFVQSVFEVVSVALSEVADFSWHSIE